jgi:hypothetical protein
MVTIERMAQASRELTPISLIWRKKGFFEVFEMGVISDIFKLY